MMKLLIICIDGLSCDYLESTHLPNLEFLIRKGFYKQVSAVIPTVTNVNNVSIVTGKFADEHGITANYYYDRESGSEHYMESADYLLSETLFELAGKRGFSSALLTSKKKLLQLLNKGVDFAVTAEDPSPEYLNKIGPGADIYSSEVDLWLFKAAIWLLRKEKPEVIYLSTTDYMMHKHSPGDPQITKHLKALDNLIGEICADDPNRELYITADHGMNNKTKALDVQRILEKYGIIAHVIPIIKDKYESHHQNLGGAAYIYLEAPTQLEKAMQILKGTEGIEEVYEHKRAAKEFSLHPSRIGDIFILGDRQTVFSNTGDTEKKISIRSHGSRYESLVPLICYPAKAGQDDCSMNKDITKMIGWLA